MCNGYYANQRDSLQRSAKRSTGCHARVVLGFAPWHTCLTVTVTNVCRDKVELQVQVDKLQEDLEKEQQKRRQLGAVA